MSYGYGGGYGSYGARFPAYGSYPMYPTEYSGTPPSSGGRKRYRDDDHYTPGSSGSRGQYRRRDEHRGRRDSEIMPTPVERFQQELWKIGDPESDQSLSSLSSFVEAQGRKGSGPVLQGFRIATTELPHKHSHLARLIQALAFTSSKVIPPPALPHGLPRRPDTIDSSPAKAEEEAKPAKAEEEAKTEDTKMEDGNEGNGEQEKTEPSMGQEIVAHLIKGFQSYLDGRYWRSARFSLLFFAHLASLSKPFVSTTSLLAVLSSLLAVLSEPGVRAVRGDECVKAVLQTLLVLKPVDPSEVELVRSEGETILSTIQSYLAGRKLDRTLFTSAEAADQYEDPLESLFAAVQAHLTDIAAVDRVILRVYLEDPASTQDLQPIELPSVLVPPEDDTVLEAPLAPPVVAGPATESDEKEVKGYGGVRLELKVLDPEATPPRETPEGAYLRFLTRDIIDVFEVNRKECAKILLELPLWVRPGTFRTPPGKDQANGDAAPNDNAWVVDNLVVESIVSSIFAVPSSLFKSVYYHSLLTELCKLSPSTVAPALGKSVRRLYSGLGAGVESGSPILDAEGLRRFAEWFAVHLSNFGFNWRWPEWTEDLALPAYHPKKIFISRVLSLEVRLSYYDRIKQTVPEEYVTAGAIAEDAPGPVFEYEQEDHPQRSVADDILQLMRTKSSVDEIRKELDGFRDILVSEQGMMEEAAKDLERDIALQCLLVVGSRSFSHFLNVLERYLALIRELTQSSAARLAILNSVSTFWRRNPQFGLIVFDKFLQYRLVDPIDVLNWAFSPTRDWIGMEVWDVLKNTVDKIKTRVAQVGARVTTLKTAEQARLEADKAAGKEESTEANADLVTAEAQLISVRSEQATVFLEIVKRFSTLLETKSTPTVAGDDEKEKWSTWFKQGWFSEFCRSFAHDLAAVETELAVVDPPLTPEARRVVDQAIAWAQLVGP